MKLEVSTNAGALNVHPLVLRLLRLFPHPNMMDSKPTDVGTPPDSFVTEEAGPPALRENSIRPAAAAAADDLIVTNEACREEGLVTSTDCKKAEPIRDGADDDDDDDDDDIDPQEPAFKLRRSQGMWSPFFFTPVLAVTISKTAVGPGRGTMPQCFTME